MWAKKSSKFIEAIKSESDVLLFIICINNYQKLMLHLNSIKKNAIKFFPEESLKESVNKSFASCISAINSSIDYLLDKLVLVTYTEIRRLLVVKLFKWTN